MKMKFGETVSPSCVTVFVACSNTVIFVVSAFCSAPLFESIFFLSTYIHTRNTYSLHVHHLPLQKLIFSPTLLSLNFIMVLAIAFVYSKDVQWMAKHLRSFWIYLKCSYFCKTESLQSFHLTLQSFRIQNFHSALSRCVAIFQIFC